MELYILNVIPLVCVRNMQTHKGVTGRSAHSFPSLPKFLLHRLYIIVRLLLMHTKAETKREQAENAFVYRHKNISV